MTPIPESEWAASRRSYEQAKLDGRPYYRGRETESAKKRVRKIVELAIRRGDLVKPVACPTCGRNDRPIDAHHQDYSKPLDVTWLCRPCHLALHAQMRLRQERAA